MECTFCSKKFSSKSNLLAHQKTTKYCLDIQGKENKQFECKYCSKTFSLNQTLNEHFNSCKEKQRKEEVEKDEKYHNSIKKLQSEIMGLKRSEKDKLTEKDRYYEEKMKHYQEKLEEKEATIAKLEAKLEKFEDAVISAKKPTNTTNNTNIVLSNTLNLQDTDRIRGIIDEGLTKNVVCNGQRGLAKFVVDNILKDADGKLMYKCVDPSRHSFEFTNSDGIIEKDVRAVKLKRALIGGDVIVRAKKSGDDLWLRDDGSMDNDRYVASGGKVMEIMTLDREDTKFRTELSALTS
jgi:hypothetical protein